MVYKPILLQLISFFFLGFYLLLSGTKKVFGLQKLISITLFLLLVSCIFLDRNYYEVTIDLERYINFYEQTLSVYDVFYSSTAWKGDFLFFLVMPFAHLFRMGPEQYISFQTIISIFLLFLGYLRFFKGSRSLAILGLFFVINSSSFYLTQGNVLRQGMASSLFILSISAVSNKKFFLYKVANLFIHKGSLFSFLSFLTPKNWRTRLFLTGLSLIIGYFSLQFFLLSLLPLPEFFKNKLEFYSSFERASNNSIVKLVILLIFNLIFLRYSNNEKISYLRAYQLFFIFSISAILFFRLDGVFSRLVLYTDAFVPILTIGMITKIGDNRLRLIALVSAITISFLYSIYVFNHPSILFNLGEYVELF
ncbi:hypothetical protein MTsPCn9_15210 [Croceitalea sp. MTPC9]|uniref:EpsG family protein n=1 Tax=unclassified Croceitalea TaxID=2632280 RepID=UPI002B3927FA|nr:hypothetical protein MTsPCn6_13920 [Croceitalea sp. MTPC6]GMN16585.1 hypothetical protein MTsPCn9_15210 [Croceitalea sp. MTPC9]